MDQTKPRREARRRLKECDKSQSDVRKQCGENGSNANKTWHDNATEDREVRWDEDAMKNTTENPPRWNVPDKPKSAYMNKLLTASLNQNRA